MKYIENLPRNFDPLAKEVLTGLRENREAPFDSLNSKLQRNYEELAAMSLDHLVENAEAAKLVGKFGSNEEAYGISVADVDGAVLRVHYYADEGVHEVVPADLSRQPIDIVTFGTPHNHAGNISSVVPAGRLVHHLFEQTDGEEYVAGNIQFVKAEDPKSSYKFKSSIFVPRENTGLEHMESMEVNPSGGYQMNRDSIHVVHWPEPTITVFFNDFKYRHEGTVFQQANVAMQKERPRIPSEEQRGVIWQSFANLARRSM